MNWKQYLYGGLIVIAGSGWLPARAVDPAIELLLLPLDVEEINRLRSGDIPADGSVITEQTISQSGLTIPSLWWAQDQFGGKLLDYWVAYSGSSTPRRVDLILNPQIWNQYNYLEQYAFVSHFGTSARNFGYSTRMFNFQGEPLAAYLCDFSPETESLENEPLENESLDATRCRVFLQYEGRGAIRGGSTIGAPLPTNGDSSP